jgi:UDP-4-amino-4,6-dideoxy-N-acetyl-beta-L-altrosamine N-acetyltransferase
MEKPVLYRDRILLRPMEFEDTDYIVRWRSDPDIIANLFSSEPLTKENHLKWFKQTHEDRLDYIICFKDNQQLKNLKSEAGIMLGNKSMQGKGLAKESFALWFTYGFKELGLNRIYVRIMSDNYTTLEFIKKLGFVQEGILKQDCKTDTGFKDVIIMGLLKSEAENKSIYDL